MSHDRTLTLAPHLQDGKAAFRELVRAFGGQEAVAALTGKSQSRICAYGLANTDDFAPADVIDAVEDRTAGLPGHPQVTRWLARRRGYGLVKLPDPAQAETGWSQMISELAREAGEVMSGVCSDLASGNDVTPAEARLRLGDAADLVRIAVELEHALKMRASE